MITCDYEDLDGFPLKFEENTTEEDKQFFIKEYPRVDTVALEKIHCTTCDVHVGTAPISEKTIRTHPVLHVTHCNKCFAFYNSGEFGKGDDGSEFYCRWCGQGGEVFCCSDCPFVFCNKCIKSNLTTKYVKEIEDNDDWKCFVCDKSILKKMRAQHWALQNFVEKQSSKIKKLNGNEEEIDSLLNEDSTRCCPRKKKKSPIPPKTLLTASLKRSLTQSLQLTPPPAKKQNTAKSPKIPSHYTYANKTVKIASKPQQSNNNNEIVCTPDILGLMSGNQESNTSPRRMQVPPLVMRGQSERGRPRNPPPPPSTSQPVSTIYHNVNGYQVDLNQAARQDIFRLPNGKLIQVRKQNALTATLPPGRYPLNSAQVNQPVPRPRVTIQPNSIGRFQRPQIHRPQGPRVIMPQQRFQARFSTPPQQLTPLPTLPPVSTVFTQQNGSISVQRAPQPDTALGKAKVEFEDKIISGMEVCQHTINKMITLTNSTSFKTSNSFRDIEGLYIHLRYLFTYTMGKYKTLQESLTEGMETLAKLDPKLLDHDEEDIEILEEKTDCIDLDSDNEGNDSPVKKVPSPAKVVSSELTNGVGTTAKIPVPSFRHMRYIDKPKEIEPMETEAVLDVEAELNVSAIQTVPIDDEQPSTSHPSFVVDAVTGQVTMMECVVKLENLEFSKSVYIKNYMAQLNASKNSSRASSVETRSSSVEKSRASSVETRSSSVEKSRASSIDKAGSSSVEKSRASSVEKARSSSVEKSRASSVDKAGTSSVEKARAFSVEKSRETFVEETRSSSVEKSRESSVEKSCTSSVDKAGSSSVEKSQESSVDKAGTSSVEKTKVQKNKNGAGPRSSKKMVDVLIEIDEDSNSAVTAEEMTNKDAEKATPEKVTAVEEVPIVEDENNASCEILETSISIVCLDDSIEESEAVANESENGESQSNNAVADIIEESEANRDDEILSEKAIIESELDILLELTDLAPTADGEFNV
ncbi:unnamed protein product [Diamesa hyperborea]